VTGRHCWSLPNCDKQVHCFNDVGHRLLRQALQVSVEDRWWRVYCAGTLCRLSQESNWDWQKRRFCFCGWRMHIRWLISQWSWSRDVQSRQISFSICFATTL